mmetsp:Transcript_77331/g.185259  ORF Transcript_77331/g.185259 Transcript_77331/m.185259 type:complete len:316 (-) Transcript_77331:30-977(-)
MYRLVELVDARSKDNILPLRQFLVDFGSTVRRLGHIDCAEVSHFLLHNLEVCAAPTSHGRGNHQLVATVGLPDDEGLLCNHLRGGNAGVDGAFRCGLRLFTMGSTRAPNEDTAPSSSIPGFGRAVSRKELLLGAKAHRPPNLHVGHETAAGEVCNWIPIPELHPSIVLKAGSLLRIAGITRLHALRREAKVRKAKVVVNDGTPQRCSLRDGPEHATTAAASVGRMAVALKVFGTPPEVLQGPELRMRRLVGGRDRADLRIRGFSPQAVDGCVKPNSDIHVVHFGRCLKEQGVPAAGELAVQRSHFLVDLIHHIIA